MVERNDPETARERANREQLTASNPAVSAFVAASAGSGKTKLLTDRLLRLMLTGAAPERIQCLTFTKAAAAEMSLRLQRMLGRWVTMPPDGLAEELLRLHVEPTASACQAARALFAKVLDLPGGMRIGTIHAFSQSLLRRFPLEAAISPHFQLVDDRDADDALTEAREDMLTSAGTSAMQQALRTLAGLCSAEAFGGHVKTLQSDRPRLQAALQLGEELERAQQRVLGVTAPDDATLIAGAVEWLGESALRDAARIVLASGSKGVADRAAAILDWLSQQSDQRAENWADWCGLFLNAAGEPRGDTALVNKVLLEKRPDLLDRYREEVARILAIEDSRRAIRLAAVSGALALLAGPVARGYAQRKDEAGLLDYDDLIDRTRTLLFDPGAAWVLYKLDGGLDHLLLDEVQDTAPQQWRIAHALTEEFFAGAGARDRIRTVFAVGDRKQSIYSFQGADTEEFDRSHDELARRVRTSGQVFEDVGLDVSFRSTGPVLALVDAVFADPLARPGVVAPGETLAHYADRAGHAGMVELWPLAPLPDPAPHRPWTVPEHNQSQTSARQLLADTLADWIRDQTDGSVMLESKGRPLTAGDVLVLVRRRDEFARALVRALKTRGVPVAGLDRMVLTDQPAVQDLMALADALLLPHDDLTFGCLLTSPLGGLSDDELSDLAIDRPGSLWDALRDRAEERLSWRRAAVVFAQLLGRVDYVSPYALFAEALGPLGGRARLFARLGPEAAEPVDELLNAALTYAGRHPPSLQGFLHWLRRSGAEVKREPEAAGNLVRIMTVHGAKGLQAPLVIVPDTSALPKDDGSIVWAEDAVTARAVPLWAPRREFRCAALDRLRAAGRQRQMEEHNRLLYVALTRAEDRLLICGWEARSVKDESWHSLVRRGFEAVATERTPFGPWDGEALRLRSAQSVPTETPIVPTGPDHAEDLPVWMGSAPAWVPAQPPPEPARPMPLAPSRPDGVELGTVPAADSPLADRDGGGSRFRRGQLIHSLLQHLPAVPEEARWDAAVRFLDKPGHGLLAGEAERIADEVLAVLAHPDLAPLFGPDSRAEVPLTGVVGNAVVGGLVDRLVVLPDRVLVADFKTNRRPPVRVEDTPVLYLRQMASYRAVLRAIFPDRRVRCALIWTREARVAILPDEMLDSHDPGHARDAA
ncbi:double-strand break repair helicase AddA [Acidisphaera sp. S103]|uniref:double-strand break repair helicase AddA n=1 Tax=Acidisphaera sp. S103 TaxID=1747223 RepID=UPI00131D6BC1|nr:double-strand break repair helicase AddA [Acidisphaera sp. S103]